MDRITKGYRVSPLLSAAVVSVGLLFSATANAEEPIVKQIAIPGETQVQQPEVIAPDAVPTAPEESASAEELEPAKPRVSRFYSNDAAKYAETAPRANLGSRHIYLPDNASPSQAIYPAYTHETSWMYVQVPQPARTGQVYYGPSSGANTAIPQPYALRAVEIAPIQPVYVR
ncbi:MAG: hypothetical protein HQL50_03475 [Magnetococcales bacterium]|nr:hypothetical protein [Magnetococcales bacterium]